MKHFLLTALFLCVYSIASANKYEVDIKDVTEVSPRSIVQKPTAFIDTDQNILSVKLLSAESFTLTVTNDKGVVIYQESLITDGTSHQYQLPILEEGFHTISIQSENKSFEGEFSL